MRVDVLIAGAGPSGVATALSLKRMAPELSVFIVDPGRRTPSVGEGLPPPAGPVLKELGLWEDFQAQGHLEAHHTRAAWGTPDLNANDYLYLGKGWGWTINRPAFDRLLWARARICADAMIGGRLTGLRQQRTGWRAIVDGQNIEARAIIDATGRAAAVGRLLGLRPVHTDRLIAVVAEATVELQGETGVTVDAAPDGWWYSAPTGPGHRVWAWLTDSDLLSGQPVGEPARWKEALRSSHAMSSLAQGAHFSNRRIVPAMTQRLTVSDETSMFLSVGDAGSCFDPASSQGIVKALRSGLFAGYALYDCLVKGDSQALRRHRAYGAAEFAAYQSQHRIHYSAETRWPDRPFWHRRNGDMQATEVNPS